MSIGSYLSGDFATAARYDIATMTDTFPPGFVASALVAARTGNHARARQAVDRLVALQPAWRERPRQELEKIFHATWMVDRLARDLAALDLGTAAAELTGSASAPAEPPADR
jgi:hypothetical protein